MVYIGLTLWQMFCAFITFYRHGTLRLNRNKKWYLILFFLGCALVMGLRAETVGYDTFRYVRHFNNFSNMEFSQIIEKYNSAYSLELGFSFLMKIFSLINPNYYFFQMGISIIYCFGIGKFIYDNVDDVFMASCVFLGLGLYFHSFNVTREYMAIMLACNGFTMLRKKKLGVAVILTIIASTIHRSAFIFFLTFLVYIFRQNKKLLKVVPVFVIICTVNYRTIVNAVTSVFTKYEKFLDGEKHATGVGLITITWIIIAVLAIYIIYNEKFDNYYRVAAILALVYVIANFLGFYVDYIERVGYYFMPFVLIVFSEIGYSINSRWLRIVYSMGVSGCFIILYLLTALTANQYQYEFFWK